MAGVMLPCYCYAVVDFTRTNNYEYVVPEKGVALSSCMVALFLIELVLAFASAIYSCCSVPSGAEGQLVSISQKFSC